MDLLGAVLQIGGLLQVMSLMVKATFVSVLANLDISKQIIRADQTSHVQMCETTSSDHEPCMTREAAQRRATLVFMFAHSSFCSDVSSQNQCQSCSQYHIDHQNSSVVWLLISLFGLGLPEVQRQRQVCFQVAP